LVGVDYLPYVRADIILDDAEYGTITAVIKAVINKSPQHIPVPELDHNGNVVGTRVIWLPRRLLDDFKAQGLWPVVKLDEYGETQKVYTVPLVI
jgi:hypothetical protein